MIRQASSDVRVIDQVVGRNEMIMINNKLSFDYAVLWLFEPIELRILVANAYIRPAEQTPSGLTKATFGFQMNEQYGQSEKSVYLVKNVHRLHESYELFAGDEERGQLKGKPIGVLELPKWYRFGDNYIGENEYFRLTAAYRGDDGYFIRFGDDGVV